MEQQHSPQTHACMSVLTDAELDAVAGGYKDSTGDDAAPRLGPTGGYALPAGNGGGING